MSIGKRLKSLRKELGITAKDLADSLNIPLRTIGGYERDENPPNEKFLVLLIEKYNININWLLTARGEPFSGNNKNISDISSVILRHNIPKIEADNLAKLIENDTTRELILNFLKAKNGDMAAIDSLIQNLTGIKVAYL